MSLMEIGKKGGGKLKGPLLNPFKTQWLLSYVTSLNSEKFYILHTV